MIKSKAKIDKIFDIAEATHFHRTPMVTVFGSSIAVSVGQIGGTYNLFNLMETQFPVKLKKRQSPAVFFVVYRNKSDSKLMLQAA